jgi:hypothetical protein
VRSLSVLLTLAISLHVVRVGGDFMALQRFLVPIMPAVVIVGALGLRGFVQWLLAIGQPRAVVAAALATIGLAAALHARAVDETAMERRSETGVDSIGWLIWFADQCSAIGQHLADVAPAGTTISTTAAGAIPYYSRLRTLDQKGLSDEWIAHNVAPRGDHPRPGHMKSAPIEYILEQQIDFVISHPRVATRPPRRTPQELEIWRRRGYRWQTEFIPALDGGWLGYWVRDDAPLDPMERPSGPPALEQDEQAASREQERHDRGLRDAGGIDVEVLGHGEGAGGAAVVGAKAHAALRERL